ncbi:MAG: response regulator transcription factor, partial [Burkholderiaceae bacterium]|nr:response regulator transcription factor [Burkholderiaceae bacterium]
QTIRNALDAGARGFIPKTSPHRVLVDALQLVLDGGTYIPPNILQGRPAIAAAAEPYRPIVHGAPSAGTRAHQHPQLSERQRQIVELLAEGLTTKEICRQLNISPNTVKTHVASIFRALGVRNRTQVVAVTQAWMQRRTLQ